MRLLPGLAALLASVVPPRLSAQTTCQCNTAQALGACVEKREVYPDGFPGACVVVPGVPGKPTYLFVADLFGGFSYRYDAARFDTTPAFKFPSPRGSNATTGITHRQIGSEVTILWAVENKILSSDVDGGNVTELGTAPMAELATKVREATGDATIVTGELGGITNHASRNTLWGVDIINDLYFEFRETGELVLVDGKPIFFFNPLRQAGGAYGNSIAYVESGGKEYFDVPVGSLTDRRPTAVHRFYAHDGAAPETYKTGDPAGLSYTLGNSLGSPQFVTGIAFWASSCGAGHSSEILLDLDEFDGEPTILQVAADEPAGAGVTDFECRQTAPITVQLTWRKTRPYDALKITRQLLNKTPAAPVVTIFENADFAADPETFTDASALDGLYEYVATVTTGAQSFTSSCRLTVGFGSLVASRRFAGRSGTTPAPFAITLIQNDRLAVSDLYTGDAELFNLDLQPTGTLDGPVTEGLTVGLAWNSDNGNLYWLGNDNRRHRIYVTDLNGQSLGSAVTVDTPLNLTTGVELGDFSYDTVANYFWTIDLLSGAIYGITPLGGIPQEHKNRQIANPEAGGLLSGGIAVAAAQDQKVALDVIVGKAAAGFANASGRFEYTRTNLAAKTELHRIDLTTVTGAADHGGLESLETETSKVQFVVGLDTRTIYKLSLERTIPPTLFRRGDANGDNAINISDPSALLSKLFKGGPALGCDAAADADASGTLDLADAIVLFSYLFKGGAAPAAPFPSCGPASSEVLSCGTSSCVDV